MVSKSLLSVVLLVGTLFIASCSKGTPAGLIPRAYSVAADPITIIEERVCAKDPAGWFYVAPSGSIGFSSLSCLDAVTNAPSESPIKVKLGRI
jgi:hypothetical protein